MQCKEWDDANSELFKESHDEAVHKNSYKSRLYDLISASLAQGHMPLCRAAAGPFGNTDQPTNSLNGSYHTGAPSFSKGATPRPLPPERQRRNPWHRGTKARWMPYAPLRRRRRPLREYSRPADWYLLPLAILTKRTEILR